MSVTRNSTIWCDADEGHCGAHYSGPWNARELRRDARPLGWVYRDGKDFCPDHAVQTTDGTSKKEE